MMCPFGVIGRHLERHKAYRCDRCPDQELPACLQACPTKALQYATVERVGGDIRKETAQHLVTAAESSVI
jgi:carbon-monoxide dehydrogenase iron sulfur subunit